MGLSRSCRDALYQSDRPTTTIYSIAGKPARDGERQFVSSDGIISKFGTIFLPWLTRIGSFSVGTVFLWVQSTVLEQVWPRREAMTSFVASAGIRHVSVERFALPPWRVGIFATS